MKKFNLVFSILICLVFCAVATAGETQIGPMIGPNYTIVNWNESASTKHVAMGPGLSAGVLFSFSSDRLIGFRTAAIQHFVITDGSKETKGFSPVAIATAGINFDKGDFRHSVGVGYGLQSLASLSRPPSFPRTEAVTGPVIDYKLASKKGSVFSYAMGMLPLGSSFNVMAFGFLGVGYDFGGSKK